MEVVSSLSSSDMSNISMKPRMMTRGMRRKFGTELCSNSIHESHGSYPMRHTRKRKFSQVDVSSEDTDSKPKKHRYYLRSSKEPPSPSSSSSESFRALTQKNKPNLKKSKTQTTLNFKPKRAHKNKNSDPLKPTRRSKRLELQKQKENTCIEEKQEENELSEQIMKLKLELQLSKIKIITRPPMNECDFADAENELCVVEYVQDIMECYRQDEIIDVIDTDFMRKEKQKEITKEMRVILLDWLIGVHKKFKLLPPTLYLCIKLIDLYLSKTENVRKTELQLIGCAALLLASKNFEIYSPDANDFVYVSAEAFQKEDLYRMEFKMLSILHYRMVYVTPLSFAERFIKIVNYPIIVKYNSRGTADAIKSRNTYTKLVTYLILYLCELSLMDYDVLARELPSKIAASAAAFAVFTMGLYKNWPLFLEEATNYKIGDLKKILKRMNYVRSSVKHPTIAKKYNTISNWCSRVDLKFLDKL